jgi:glycosyltransferase involved in cell wall biosynthesis
MTLTVIIPGYKRAQYLFTALESIKRQTALASIEKIIVSENSEDPDSEKVCEQFPELRISFIRQRPQLNVLEHFVWILDQSSSTYTAMLHDDDWWYPTHIENALKSLNEGNVSYFSNVLFTSNEIYKAAFLHYPSLISYLCGDKSAFNVIPFTFEQVATLCYLYTPFHMSSMVALTSAMKFANEYGLKNSHPWYADRVFYPYLSLKGPLAWNPQFLCGIRQHSKNDAKTFDFNERVNAHREGSKKILDLANSNSVNILHNWQLIKDKIQPHEWQEVLGVYNHYFNNSSLLDKSNPFFKELENVGVLTRVKQKLKDYF